MNFSLELVAIIEANKLSQWIVRFKLGGILGA